jgi:hypothetical protein
MAGVRLGEAIALHDTKMAQERTWTTGDKTHRTLRGSREKGNAKRHAVAKKKWVLWNKEAAPIWEKRPNLTTLAVARIVQKKLELSENIRTIARRLKKQGQAG